MKETAQLFLGCYAGEQSRNFSGFVFFEKRLLKQSCAGL